MKKAKVIKGIKIGVSVLLALAVIILGILFFPLMGEKHIEVWSADQQFDITALQTVEKTREDFKILMLTDTQLWSDLGKNKECYEQIDKLVEQTQPDLMVLPGDNLSAFASRFSIGNFIKHLDSYGIPWAPTFGNHDAEIPTASKNWQGDKFLESEHSLFQKGPSNLYGCGNYALNITEDGEPVYTVFMLDNGEYMEYEDGKSEVYMGYEQIAWYEWNVRGLAEAAGRTVPSMTFSHFALPEFSKAVEELGVFDEKTGRYMIPEEHGFGYCSYIPGSSPVNSGFFDKCKELGSTKYMFCGHDHENNASVTYDGITMTYGLKTGPSPVPWNGATEMGGTVITISGKGAQQQVEIEHTVIETR